MSVSTHGIDTVRATYRVLDAIPHTDEEYRHELFAAGFRSDSRQWLEDGELVWSETLRYRDTENPTLGLDLRAGEYLTAEFSAPRLLDDSPVNLRLASGDQVTQLLDDVRATAESLIPGANLQLHKLNRLDYAVDLAAGQMLPGVISAAAQFRFPRVRKASTHVYPGETATIRSAQHSFRCYSKGLELEHKLKPKQRQEFGNVIQLAKQQGLTRMELTSRPKGGLAMNRLFRGAFDFAESLETGLGGGVVMVGGLAKLEAEIAALGLSSQRESTLLKFATRYAVLGEDGMKARYSKPTFYRHRKLFIEQGLRLDDVCTYQGEVDFRPAIELLRAA